METFYLVKEPAGYITINSKRAALKLEQGGLGYRLVSRKEYKRIRAAFNRAERRREQQQMFGGG